MLIIIIYIISGLLLGYILKSFSVSRRRKDDEKNLRNQINKFKEETQQKVKYSEVEIKKEKERIKKEFEKSKSGIQEEIKLKQRDIEEKSSQLDAKADIIEKKELEISKRQKDIQDLESKYEEKEKELEEIRKREQTVLEKISKYSPRQAREQLMRDIENEAAEETQRLYNRIVDNARRDAQRKAVEIIAQAIQRNASDVTQELTVSTVSIDDDMKGRIIGREGRNIRALEAATGVNLIIDDTPGVITISSFDGVRREVAHLSLEILIKDKRIQPARIEEVVSKIKKEIDNVVKKSGEDAAMEAGVTGLHDELINLLGKLKYRTSYGQNVLDHTVSVAHLAGVMADELEIDGAFARRAGLLHDIGKAVDREIQGNHVEIGAKLAKKHGESERVQNAILAHHEDVEPTTAEAILIQAADAISAARPGARHEQLDSYMKRMTDIETIAKDFEGVNEAYCLYAGREIRLIVEPDKVSDIDAKNIAKKCAKQIEEKIEYPGEIKVTVIRSMRSTEIAK